MITIKCPHLTKWLTFACKAKEVLYFPSPFQLDEYCKRKSHRTTSRGLSHCPARKFNVAVILL